MLLFRTCGSPYSSLSLSEICRLSKVIGSCSWRFVGSGPVARRRDEIRSVYGSSRNRSGLVSLGMYIMDYFRIPLSREPELRARNAFVNMLDASGPSYSAPTASRSCKTDSLDGVCEDRSSGQPTVCEEGKSTARLIQRSSPML
jgi:hypothetical protein